MTMIGRPARPNTRLRCPACESVKPLFKARAGHGNAYSRYADRYICSECGTREAFEGFFWRAWCLKRYVKAHHREGANASKS